MTENGVKHLNNIDFHQAYSDGPVQYWVRPPLESRYYGGINAPVRHLIVIDGNIWDRHPFKYKDVLPEEHFLWWTKFGRPEPVVFGLTVYNEQTLGSLVELTEMHGIVPSVKNLDLLKVTLTLKSA